MATEADLRNIEQAFCQPSAWKITQTLGSIISTLPRIANQSPIRVLSGRHEEMMNKLGYNTAWTDGVTITFTEKFLKKLTPLGVAFVLLHECGHIAFKHFGRRQGRNPYWWNIAGDIKINDAIVRFIMPAMLKSKTFSSSLLFETKRPLGIGFTPNTEHLLTDHREHSEEQIYFLQEEKFLQRGQKKGKGGGKGGPGGGSGGGGGGGGGGSMDPSDYDFDGAGDDAFDDHVESGLELRKRLEDEFGEEGKAMSDSMSLPNSEEAQKRMDNAAAQAVSTARQLSRTANKGVGGPVDMAIEDAIEIDRAALSKYQWKFNILNIVEEAQQGPYMEDIDKADELSEWSRIPELRDLMGMGEVFRPDLVRRSGRARALIVLDTSGSMSEDDLKLASIETKEIFVNNRLELRVVSADTSSRAWFELMPDDDFPIPMKIAGGGGTDMLTPVVEEICKSEKKFDVVIVLTDGFFYSYNYQTLVEEVKKIDPLAVNKIPPLAFVITTPHFNDPQLDANAATFPPGGCSVFELDAPDNRRKSNQVEIRNDGLAVG